MKSSINFVHKTTLLDRRVHEGMREFSVFFWEVLDGVVTACMVKVRTNDPGEALRLTRCFHPTGSGFCFAQGDGSRVPNHRPRLRIPESESLCLGA